LKHDEVPPANKLIDFAKHMDDLKARTELEVPYCMTQCEDAMYLDKHSVVSLEYQYYQNGCKYSKLKEIIPTVAPNGKLLINLDSRIMTTIKFVINHCLVERML
jgi:hypothetical protein